MVERDENGRVVSGVLNPNGRPKKGETLTDILTAKLDKEEFIERLIALSEKDDLSAIKYIFDRIDGLMSSKLVLGGDEEHPVQVDIVLHGKREDKN